MIPSIRASCHMGRLRHRVRSWKGSEKERGRLRRTKRTRLIFSLMGHVRVMTGCRCLAPDVCAAWLTQRDINCSGGKVDCRYSFQISVNFPYYLPSFPFLPLCAYSILSVLLVHVGCYVCCWQGSI